MKIDSLLKFIILFSLGGLSLTIGLQLHHNLILISLGIIANITAFAYLLPKFYKEQKQTNSIG
jgi:hypothetical protein